MSCGRLASNNMWDRVRAALARGYARVWRRVGMLMGGEHEVDVESHRSAAARAHFWEEFRDGQREAEDRSTRDRR